METSPLAKPVLVIDGSRFDDLEGFYDEVARQLVPDATWGRNLDAFNDILRGGFGTPEGGFVLHWKNAARSRRVLGHAETAAWLRQGMSRIHPSNVPEWEARLARALVGKGETLFDILVAIVRVHCAGGSEEDDGIELRLEEKA
ncbi:MAG: barstar family protein [Planctomycetes bacterium]|nr:barstar family protein [Planctomycetota bacterium]